MSNEEKTYPTHRVLFASQKIDQQGHAQLSVPVQIGAVWPRKNGKQGGILDWDLSPGSLGEGTYFLRENKTQDQMNDQNAEPKTYRIAFSEKRAAQPGGKNLGRPVEVASVEQGGEIKWAIAPERLNNGVFFVLENERTQTQGAPKHADAFAKVEARKQERNHGLER